MKNAIQYGETAIDYELLMVNRKSLEIAVHPDKSVVVKAPLSASQAAIEERLRKRARWIKRQIAYFMQFDPRTPPRRYVGGESHLYLGRKYRLKISESARDHVLLKNGYFYIESRDHQSDPCQATLERLVPQQSAALFHGGVQQLLGKLQHCWTRKTDLTTTPDGNPLGQSFAPRSANPQPTPDPDPQRVHRIRRPPRALPLGPQQPHPRLLPPP